MAQSQPQTDPFRAALDLQKQDRWQESIGAIETVVRAHGPHPIAFYIAGIAHEKLGEIKTAATLFEASLKMDRSFIGLLALGKAYVRLNDPAAIIILQEALAKKTDSVETLRQLGAGYLNAEDNANAEKFLRAANTAEPSGKTHFNLGILKLRTNRPQEAVTHFSDAIALDDNDLDAWEYLGQSYVLLGQHVHAVLIFYKLAQGQIGALAYQNLLTEVLRTFSPEKFEQVYEDALLFCLNEPRLTLDNLGNFFAALLSVDPNRPLLNAALKTATYEEFADVVKNADLAELDNPLLAKGLSSFIVRNPTYEHAFTTLRQYCLTHPAIAGQHIPFVTCLAAQCFLNEYVYDETDAEKSSVHQLQTDLQQATTWNDDIALKTLLLAAYRPLYALSDTTPIFSAINIAAAPATLTAILNDQITTVRTEKDFGRSIPALKGDQQSDETSQAVRAMYEENPYPRWKNLYRTDEGLNSVIDVAALTRNAENGMITILNAGCGTGRHVFLTHANFPGAHITAVDLSRASLGFAKMRCVEHNLQGVDFFQGDILELGDIGRQFDVVECAGVLHHMKDPMRGWHILTKLLKPKGVMRIGLYSETARRDVVAARNFIAEKGFAPTLDGIRGCRRALKELPFLHPAKGVIGNPDFYSTSLCRDLIFHIQEHRFTLPQIKDCLAELGLEILSFNITKGQTMVAYRNEYPDDPKMRSIDNWHAFEQKHPHTFANMYQFWCQKTTRA